MPSAIIACQSASVRLTAAVFMTEDGWVSEILMRESDPLRTPGVPGTRLRINRADYPEFDATVLIGAATWPAALAVREQLHKLAGRLIDLTLDGGGQLSVWPGTMVHAISQAQAVPGALVGATSYTHHVRAVLRLQVSKESS
jgi:hypothetical protein